MTNDTSTPQLFVADLAGEVPRKPTASELTAARVKRFREKHGLRAVTLNLPADLVAELDAWIVSKGKGRTKSQVIEKLIRTQLLRPR
jgi:hypothetical protein